MDERPAVMLVVAAAAFAFLFQSAALAQVSHQASEIEDGIIGGVLTID